MGLRINKAVLSAHQAERGAIMSEYAIALGLLIPIFLFASLILYEYSDNNPGGKIVERGEGSLVPARDMSPTRLSLCYSGNEEMCM